MYNLPWRLALDTLQPLPEMLCCGWREVPGPGGRRPVWSMSPKALRFTNIEENGFLPVGQF